MKILNFGSLNLDLVYQIPHFVRAGETLSTTGFSRNVGGKGLNQSVALAKAGASFIPSPIIATLCPSACNAATCFSFSVGKTSAITFGIRNRLPMASAVF